VFRKTETISQIFPTVSQNPQSGKSGVNCGYITITNNCGYITITKIH